MQYGALAAESESHKKSLSLAARDWSSFEFIQKRVVHLACVFDQTPAVAASILFLLT